MGDDGRDDLFRRAWVPDAVDAVGLLGTGLVGVHKWSLTATVRPTKDVP